MCRPLEDTHMSTKAVDAESSSRWRDPSNYPYTAGLTRDDLAWEFLRRNRAYAELAATRQATVRRTWQEPPAINVTEAADTSGDASAWGLHFLRSCRPSRPFRYRLLAERSKSYSSFGGSMSRSS